MLMLFYRRDAFRRRRDLDHDVGSIQLAPKPPSLVYARLGIMCQIGRDFNAGKPVDALTPIVGSSEYVGGGADVLDRQVLVDPYRRTACSVGGADALVVIMAVDDGLLEDAGIGCYAADTVILDEARERAGADETTTERVEPDTLTALFECV
jgi:hypothetical protein